MAGRAGRSGENSLPQDENEEDPQTLRNALLASNKYVALSDSDDDMQSDVSLAFSNTHTNKSNNNNTAKKTKKRKLTVDNANGNNSKSSSKPPPIFLKGISRAEVDKILSSLDAERNKFISKNLPDGIKVFAADTASHLKLREKLIAMQAKFQTHLLREEQTTKVVLHGLHEMELKELKNELSRERIFPADIKKLTIRKKMYDDHCVYLLYFKKTDKIRVADLRKTTAICYTRVRWEYYSIKRKAGENEGKAPIQCSNCMQFGHGGRNCFLDPVCIRCGESHKSIDCPLLSIINPETKAVERLTRIDDAKLKCGLCGQNHAANFSKCEKRKEFIDRRNKFNTKMQKKSKSSTQVGFKAAPELAQFNFPQINRSKRNGDAWTNFLEEPYSIQQNAHSSRQNQGSQQNRQQASANDDDLFDANELLSIFRELMSTLKTAKTRDEQIFALGQLVIKHCYGSR